MNQTKLKPSYEIKPNENISFPIGTILGVQNCYDKLDFFKIFSKYKKKGRDINSLIQSLVSYKLTDNFSICRGSDLININFHIRMLILTGQALFYLEINANLENMDIQETIALTKNN